MKTLIMVIRPDIASSVINKIGVDELDKHPEKYEVRLLHQI
jgi:hypothetical protein